MIEMAEFWARIAADRGGRIAVAPFSRRVSPRCIILFPALRASPPRTCLETASSALRI